jgi:hypothetical protein
LFLSSKISWQLHTNKYIQICNDIRLQFDSFDKVRNNDFQQSIKQTLLDQFLQDWNSSVHNSPKASNYRIFKTDFKFEEYFNILDEQSSLLLSFNIEILLRIQMV